MTANLPEWRQLRVERFAAAGDGAVIRPPFHCDYGFNIRLDAGVFPNFNRVILDVAEVTIGDRTQIGPGVQILAADHPRDPAVRASGLEFSRPVRIGRNVWIGAGAIILPGVSIGDDALIGAGTWSPVMCPPGLPPSAIRHACGPRQPANRTLFEVRDRRLTRTDEFITEAEPCRFGRVGLGHSSRRLT